MIPWTWTWFMSWITWFQSWYNLDMILVLVRCNVKKIVLILRHWSRLETKSTVRVETWINYPTYTLHCGATRNIRPQYRAVNPALTPRHFYMIFDIETGCLVGACDDVCMMSVVQRLHKRASKLILLHGYTNIIQDYLRIGLLLNLRLNWKPKLNFNFDLGNPNRCQFWKILTIFVQGYPGRVIFFGISWTLGVEPGWTRRNEM